MRNDVNPITHKSVCDVVFGQLDDQCVLNLDSAKCPLHIISCAVLCGYLSIVRQALCKVVVY